MKYLFSLVLLMTVVVYADTIYQTYPGTNTRDHSKPAIVSTIKNGRIESYETYPETTTRNYERPSYITDMKTGEVYQTYPGTSTRDYSQPTYKRVK